MSVSYPTLKAMDITDRPTNTISGKLIASIDQGTTSTRVIIDFLGIRRRQAESIDESLARLER